MPKTLIRHKKQREESVRLASQGRLHSHCFPFAFMSGCISARSRARYPVRRRGPHLLPNRTIKLCWASIVLLLSLDLYTTWMWIILPTFRRHMLPPSSGSKYVRCVNFYVQDPVPIKGGVGIEREYWCLVWPNRSPTSKVKQHYAWSAFGLVTCAAISCRWVTHIQTDRRHTRTTTSYPDEDENV